MHNSFTEQENWPENLHYSLKTTGINPLWINKECKLKESLNIT